jgi:Ni/Co efflux regulator RcnB
MKGSIITALLVLIFAFTSPAQAGAGTSVGIVFSDDEISIIGAWYRDHGTISHKRGGKKQKGLPPGIAKNLARGKPLPPGIAKNYLPDGLRQALPPPPKGYERIIVDGKVLLVEIATRVIHDILVDIVLD